MKLTALKKESKQPISKIQKQIWNECRRIQGFKLADKDGKVNCYTCDAKDLVGSNRQLGHVPWPKSVLGAFLKYDLRVLKWQCSGCNIWHGGMGAEAYKRMLQQEGEAFMQQLEADRQVTVKAYDYYVELLEKYRKIKNE